MKVYRKWKKSSRTSKGEEKIGSRISTAIKRDNEAYKIRGSKGVKNL